jgi:hypothetical protein
MKVVYPYDLLIFGGAFVMSFYGSAITLVSAAFIYAGGSAPAQTAFTIRGVRRTGSSFYLHSFYSIQNSTMSQNTDYNQ